ncbi:hypothetical protein HY857_02115 [Candidatus Saccharibacteria bacterium]|nr:hypothetical protein [Candidatus Saccharibacteria bacterium]
MSISINVLEQPISKLVNKTRSKTTVEYPVDDIWNPEGISLESRTKNNPELKKRIDRVLEPKNLKKYIVSVNTLAPTRCIDGRITLDWDKQSELRKAYLGPKIAGGTAHAALAHRIVDTHHLVDDLLFEHDIEYVVNRYKKIGIGFGGHIDTHQHGWNTGCGAVDNINLILDLIKRPEAQLQLRGLARMIMGDAYDGSFIANEVIGRMLFLNALLPSYMPKENGKPGGEFLYKKTVVELIRNHSDAKHESVPRLSGDHNEIAIILNSLQGTTIDTDRLSFDNNNEIQVFGWDLWEVYKEAARLYPYDVHATPTSQQRAVAKRTKHVTIRALLGVATIMVLTDGSLRVATVSGSVPSNVKVGHDRL